MEITGLIQANIPPYLEKYEDSKYENTGSLKEPDFGEINEIGPDLIIISGRQQETYEELSEIGPTIFMEMDTNNYMDSFDENMKALGEILAEEEEVEKQLAAADESIKALNGKATANGSNGLIVLANEGNPSA